MKLFSLKPEPRGWHPVYAWLPMGVDGTVVWLEWVERLRIDEFDNGAYIYHVYRRGPS